MSRLSTIILSTILLALLLFIALTPSKGHAQNVLPEAQKTLCIQNDAGDYMYFLETIKNPSTGSRVAVAQTYEGSFILGEWIIVNKTRILAVWVDRQGQTYQAMYYTSDLEACYF